MNEETKKILKDALTQVTKEIAVADQRLRELTELDEERGSLDHLRSALIEALQATEGKET